MYKKRLRKWNIRKRNYRKNQTPTTISTPSPSGVLSDHEYDDDDDVEEEIRSPTTSDSALSLVQPSSLQQYAVLEMILGNVSSWSQGKLETAFVVSDPMSKYLANPNHPHIQDSRTMYRTFELVFDLWRRGRGNLAGMAARKGFYVLESVLTDDHPDLIWHMLDTIYDMVETGHLQLLGMFLNHALVLAHAKLPAQHPLLRILQQLTRCDYQTDEGRQYICHLLRQAWLRNVDVLGAQIGSMAPQHLWLYEQLIWDGRSKLRKNSNLKRRRDDMSAALTELDAKQTLDLTRPTPDKLRVEALMLEFTQMDLEDKAEAEKMALELLQHTEDPDNTDRSNARFQAYALKMLARIHEGRGDLDGAEQRLRQAIDKREAAHGTNSNLRVVRDMWVLSKHYKRKGRQEEADQVVADAIDRAALYLEDLPG